MSDSYHLFNLTHKTFSDFFRELNETEISSICDYRVFQRGFEYKVEGLVKEVDFFPNSNRISALVRGRETYSVEIYEYSGAAVASCTCPYGNICKHIVAVLLYIAENDFGNEEKILVPESPGATTGNAWHQYLSSLNKNELINLIDKFAPSSFRIEIQNRASGLVSAKNVFMKVEKLIHGYFKDEELLYTPSDFEASLLNQLEKLRGFESHLRKEIQSLIIFIIVNVNNAFDQGYLYIDNYDVDDYFESEEFGAFTLNFTRNLPFEEKTDFVLSLNEALDMMSYSTFEDIASNIGHAYNEDEIEKLIEVLRNSLAKYPTTFISRLYDRISAHINVSLKEEILNTLRDEKSTYFTELCELYISEGRSNEAYIEIKKYLDAEHGYSAEKLCLLFLELSKKLNYDLSEAAKRIISRCPQESVISRIKVLAYNELSNCEDILKDKNPNELLNFYEKEQRFSDALELIGYGRIWETEVLRFFKKNKQYCISQAETFFTERISKNLENTGDNFYLAVTESLSQLKQINPSKAKLLVDEIRVNYKRRPKLMGMIDRI